MIQYILTRLRSLFHNDNSLEAEPFYIENRRPIEGTVILLINSRWDRKQTPFKMYVSKNGKQYHRVYNRGATVKPNKRLYIAVKVFNEHADYEYLPYKFCECNHIKYNIGGDISCLLAGPHTKPILDLSNYKGGLQNIFMNEWVVDASDLKLPAMKLCKECYVGMFYKCAFLQYPPKVLPCEELAPECYMMMFYETDLSMPPKINATKYATDCFFSMFYGCYNLSKPMSMNVNAFVEYLKDADNFDAIISDYIDSKFGKVSFDRTGVWKPNHMINIMQMCAYYVYCSMYYGVGQYLEQNIPLYST